MSTQYRARYELYVPKLEAHGWSPVETVTYEVRFMARSYTKAFEIAGILKPEHAEITAVDTY